MEHSYCIDSAVKMILNSKTGIMKNSINTKKLLKKLLGVKTVFADVFTDEIKKVKKEFDVEEFVSYSYDTMIIPKEASLDEKKQQLISKAIELLTIRSFKVDNKITVKSGFQFVELEYDKNDELVNVIAKNSYLNHIATNVYSRFIQSRGKYPDVTLNTFIDFEASKQLPFDELIFIECSISLGNDVLFEAFKSGDFKKIDNVLRERGSSFEELGESFEIGIDPEYARLLTQLEAVDIDGGYLLNGELFERILNSFEEIYANEYGKNIDLKDTKEYFVNSYYYNLFGKKILIEDEIQKLKKFYKHRDFINIIKIIKWNKKYKSLRKQSVDIAFKLMNGFGKNNLDDIIQVARKLLADTEKLNCSLEKETEKFQDLFFKDIKEIFMNCMFVMTNDKTVISRDLGKLYNLQLIAEKVKGMVRE